MRKAAFGACLLSGVAAIAPGWAQNLPGSQPNAAAASPSSTQHDGRSPSTDARPQASLAPAAPAPAPKQQVSVAALTDGELTGASGVDLGDIARVVENRSDQKAYLVVSRGGFMGFLDKEFLVPADRVAMRRGRIVAPLLTETDLRSLPVYGRSGDQYRELEDSQTITIAQQD
jgi:hypothetical protein